MMKRLACGIFVLTLISVDMSAFAMGKSRSSHTSHHIQHTRDLGSNSRATSSNSDIHIAAVGDILIHNPLIRQGMAKQKNGGFKTLWEQTIPLIKKADIAYGNIEGPMADSQAAQSKQMSFNFPSRLAGDLKDSGFDIVSTANNHSYDRSLKGLQETIETLDNYKLDFMGTRKSTSTTEGFYKITKVKGISILWLACTAVKNRKDKGHVADCRSHKSVLSNIIKTAKAKNRADLVVLTPHWGSEKKRANSSQKSLATYYFTQGVDLILGAHAHVLQKAEFKEIKDVFGVTKNRLVMYSLGNFVSNQLYWGAPQRTGVVANIYITQKNGQFLVKDYDVVPVDMYRYSDKSYPNSGRKWMLTLGSKSAYREAARHGLKIAK